MKQPLRWTGSLWTVLMLAVGFAAGRFFDTKRPVGLGAFTAASGRSAAERVLPAAVIPAPKTGSETWSAQWARLVAQPPSVVRDEALGRLLEQLARNDSARALALAEHETNRLRQKRWLRAALRGWATRAPRDAAAWIDARPDLERESVEAAVMEGASENAATAIPLAESWVQHDPAGARSHANQLLRVLANRGEFDTGVAFAEKLPAELRAEMLGTAFQYWAQTDAPRAMAAAMQLSSGEARQVSLDAAASGWAQVDPAGLAEYARRLGSQEDRTQVLETALREWVQQDPGTASHWLDLFPPAPELDAGAAAVALQPALLAIRPNVSLEWAESIVNPVLKSNTLASVVREWATHDPASAWNFAESSPELLSEDRVHLLAELSVHSPAASP